MQYFSFAVAELRKFRLSIFLVRKQTCGTSDQVFSLCEIGIAELSGVKYFPCAEAELRNFRSQYILVADAELKVTQYFPCVEAELLMTDR